MHSRIEEFLDDVRAAWRYRWHGMAAAWLFGMLGWLALFFWPDMYQASARVFVDTRTALKPVLQGLAVEQDVNAQLNFVRQSLLGSPLLEKIAKETDQLTPTIVDPRKRAKVIEDMRERIVVTVKPASESGGDRDTGGSVYGLVYKDQSRDRSLKVVQALVQSLVEDTLGGKRQGSQNAQRFLETQIHDYELKLQDAENRLANFKKTNVGVMPSEQGGYFSRLQTEMDAVRAGESALAVAQSKREEIQKQLRGESAITAASSPVAVAGVPGVTGGDLQSRIREAQAKLDELQLRFTDRHPDVVAARETLEELKRRRVVEIESLRQGDASAVASSGAAANPVYQSMQLALNQVNIEIATLERQLTDHRMRVAELRTALNTMPQVEAEFAQLNRDYDVNKTQFTALLTQLEKAKLGQEADTSGSVRFEVIEPPNADYKTVSPRRSILVGAILVVALGIGAGIAYLFKTLHPAFWSPRVLRAKTGMPVLSVVSSAFPASLRSRSRRSALWFSAAAISLVLAGMVVLRLSQLGLRLALPQYS